VLLDDALSKGAENGVKGGDGGGGGGGDGEDVSLEEEDDYNLLLANTGVGGASKGPPRILRFVELYLHKKRVITNINSYKRFRKILFVNVS
jgi:hypothetical protein